MVRHGPYVSGYPYPWSYWKTIGKWRFNGKTIGKWRFNGKTIGKWRFTGAFYAGLLDGLLGVAGMMKLRMWWNGSFPKIPCVKRTSKWSMPKNDKLYLYPATKSAPSKKISGSPQSDPYPFFDTRIMPYPYAIQYVAKHNMWPDHVHQRGLYLGCPRKRI